MGLMTLGAVLVLGDGLTAPATAQVGSDPVRPLVLKGLIAGRTGKTGINGAICYQIATKITASGFEG
jgi:hypothetical protein